MIRIGIAGGPGSGKSSLARQLTTELYNKRRFNAQYVTEFARDYINRALMHGKFTPSIADQFVIFNSQIEREDIVPGNADFLIADSPIFLSLIFAYNNCDMSNFQQRSAYISLYETFIGKYLKRYDHVFVLQRQKDFLKDGTRHETAEEADEIGRQIMAFLNLHKIPFNYIMAETDVARVNSVLKTLGIKPDA